MNYPTENKVSPPVEISQNLLDAVRIPEIIDQSIPFPKRRILCESRNKGIVRICSFLHKRNVAQVVGSGHYGGDSHTLTIDYLDRCYTGWRGYEVVYVDGRKG